jgi:signal transduction histidine kinase
MARPLSTSLSAKLTRMNLLVTGSALLLAGGAFAAYDFVTFRDAMARNLSIQAQIAGANSVSAIVFNDSRLAGETLASLQASPNVVSAQIYTPQGEVFASYWRSGVSGTASPRVIPAGQTEVLHFTLDAVSLDRQIMLDGKPVGSISIQSSLQSLYQRLGRYLGSALVVLVAALLMAFLISKLAQRAISGPLVELASLARQVAEEKDYGVRGVHHPKAAREVTTLIAAFNEMLARLQSDAESLRKGRELLEAHVRQRTAELDATNQELEAFSYSVSHDLRAPLRHIVGFASLLQQNAAAGLDDKSRRHLATMVEAATRMGRLIDDLLAFSRMGRGSLSPRAIELAPLVREAKTEVLLDAGGRAIEWDIQPLPVVWADPALLRPAIVNLLSNAVKYTGTREAARIEVGSVKSADGETVVFVRDNGVGFDMQYADKLFGVFQRLHRPEEFTGTGIGLANVRRIVARHGGRTWADAQVNRGATFYFSLPEPPAAGESAAAGAAA